MNQWGQGSTRYFVSRKLGGDQLRKAPGVNICLSLKYTHTHAPKCAHTLTHKFTYVYTLLLYFAHARKSNTLCIQNSNLDNYGFPVRTMVSITQGTQSLGFWGKVSPALHILRHSLKTQGQEERRERKSEGSLCLLCLSVVLCLSLSPPLYLSLMSVWMCVCVFEREVIKKNVK